MPPDMMKDTLGRDHLDAKRENGENPRELTHDEKKAAEAAFRGAPFNPAWSSSAARVYVGILTAMNSTQTAAFADSDISAECLAGR